MRLSYHMQAVADYVAFDRRKRFIVLTIEHLTADEDASLRHGAFTLRELESSSAAKRAAQASTSKSSHDVQGRHQSFARRHPRWGGVRGDRSAYGTNSRWISEPTTGTGGNFCADVWTASRGV